MSNEKGDEPDLMREGYRGSTTVDVPVKTHVIKTNEKQRKKNKRRI